jgi:6,7-dimethyl-8-ribityllumazine synthase
MVKHRFENRFIAFVDILGFSDLIERMSREDRLFKTVRDALGSVDKQARIFKRYRSDVEGKLFKDGSSSVSSSDLQMTAFSDCYVLSEVEKAWHVVAAVQALGSQFLAEGILTRGAVVQGQAYHKDRVLFGSGIIEAYELESKVAVYPRILVSGDVRQAVWDYHTQRWKGQLLKRDVDGCWFVNLLVPSLSKWKALSNAPSGNDSHAHLTTVRKSLISAWKRVQGDTRRMSKVWWLIHRFNRLAEKERLEPIERRVHQ